MSKYNPILDFELRQTLMFRKKLRQKNIHKSMYRLSIKYIEVCDSYNIYLTLSLSLN
jgi:hypothetical protein